MALAPLVAISGANAAMDEMEAPEMRVWSAVLSEPGDEAPGAELQIVATRSPGGNTHRHRKRRNRQHRGLEG